MAKILKRKTLRKSNKRRPQRKVIKRNVEKDKNQKVLSEAKPQENPKKEMSLRETLMFQQMMNQQRGVSQVPQSALDGFKHDMHSTMVKVKEELALEKQHRAALQKQFDAQNYKDKTEANMQIEDNATALANETTKMQTKRLQEEAKGENELALQKQLNVEYKDILLDTEHEKKMFEIKRQTLIEKGYSEEMIRKKDLLADEIELIMKNIKVLTQNTPEVVQEDKLITGMMANLCESAQALLNRFNEIFTTKGKWDMMKAQKIPSMIANLQKEKAIVDKQINILNKNITRKESELDELYALEDEKKKVERKKEETEATNEALDKELQKNIVRDNKKYTRAGYREYLIKSNNNAKIAIHDEEHKQSILKQKQKHVDTLELEKENLGNQAESLKIANNVHEQLVKDQNTKIKNLSQENANKALEVEALKTKNAEHQVFTDAHKRIGIKKKTLEIELIEQKAEYDQNNPKMKAFAERTKELETNMAETAKMQQEVNLMKDLGKSQDELRKHKMQRNAQVKLNSSDFSSEERISQAITDNEVLIDSYSKDDQLRSEYLETFNRVMNENPKLNEKLAMPEEDFMSRATDWQCEILKVIKMGLERDEDQIKAFDKHHGTTYHYIMSEFWDYEDNHYLE